MPERERSLCGLVTRILILFLGLTGIILSALSSADCEFLLFKNTARVAWPTLTDPYDGVIEAHLGMFSYRILDAIPRKRNEITEDCVQYQEQFLELDNPFLAGASISAFCAPIFAGAGLLFCLMETCICNFVGSFCISSSAILFAAALQAATFVVFAEQDYCFSNNETSEQQCEVGSAAVLSGVAAFLFWISGLLICCAPRPDPFCFSSNRGGNTSSSSKKKGGSKNNNEGEPEQVVIQPVIIDDNDFDYDDDDNEDDEDDLPAPPTRKASGVSVGSPRKASSAKAKITDDDFDFDDNNNGDGTRTEVKEREFPDGSRQVDEITHYPDGSKSVKTQMFQPEE